VKTVESTKNFADGLELARAELSKDGKPDEKDGRVIRALLDKPVIERDGRKIRALYRVHVRTRAMYAKLNRGASIGNLDWTKLVQWIKDHWMEIVRIILTVAPFILL